MYQIMKQGGQGSHSPVTVGGRPLPSPRHLGDRRVWGDYRQGESLASEAGRLWELALH